MDGLKKIAQIVSDFSQKKLSRQDALKSAIDEISRSSGVYNWVGIYVVDPGGTTLTLFDYYIGRPTTHTRIPVSEGICGAAVRENQTLIVDDVKSDPRYLSCSIETQSEIVVPIRRGSKVIAEIDIDSDEKRAFDVEDSSFLERVAFLIEPLI